MPFCNCSLLFASRCLVLFWQSTGSFSHDLNFTVSITNTSSVHVEIIVVNVAIRKFPLNKKSILHALSCNRRVVDNGSL